MTHITLRVEKAYGQERKYVIDPKISSALQRLTRRTTVSDDDVQALIELGFTVSESSVLGREVA